MTEQEEQEEFTTTDYENIQREIEFEKENLEDMKELLPEIKQRKELTRTRIDARKTILEELEKNEPGVEQATWSYQNSPVYVDARNKIQRANTSLQIMQDQRNIHSLNNRITETEKAIRETEQRLEKYRGILDEHSDVAPVEVKDE